MVTNPYRQIDKLIDTCPDTNINYRDLEACKELARKMRDHFGMAYSVVKKPRRRKYTLTVNELAASKAGYELFYTATLAGRREKFDWSRVKPNWSYYPKK
jgi:hypothetical protein